MAVEDELAGGVGLDAPGGAWTGGVWTGGVWTGGAADPADGLGAGGSMGLLGTVVGSTCNGAATSAAGRSGLT